jgi:hypothetical protein
MSSPSISSLSSPQKRKRPKSVHFETTTNETNQEDDTGKLIAQGLSMMAKSGSNKVENDIFKIQNSLSKMEQASTDSSIVLGHVLDAQQSVLAGQEIPAIALNSLLEGQQSLAKGQSSITNEVQASSKTANQIRAQVDAMKSMQNETRKSLTRTLTAHKDAMARGSSNSQLVPQGHVFDQTDVNASMQVQLKGLLKSLTDERTTMSREPGWKSAYNSTGPCEICQGSHPFFRHPNLEDENIKCLWEKKKKQMWLSKYM